VPAQLVTTTIHAAAVFAATPLTAGALPAPVLTLTEGVLKAMFLNKLKTAVVVVAAAALLTTGISGLAFRASAGEQGPKQKPPAGPSVEKTTAGPDDELRQLRTEVAKLRAELESLRKQVPSTPANLLRTEAVERPAKDEGTDAKLVVRVYPVRDLLEESVEPPPAASITQVLMSSVQPESWNAQGGPGSMEYFAPGRSLVIRQTASVHEQVKMLLEELRRAKEEDSRKADSGRRPGPAK
jgi:hypothetical protein